MASGTQWRALYVFMDDHALLEDYLLDCIVPLVREDDELTRNWFFIRYWEGGPHLRLRVRDRKDGELERLRHRLQRALPAPGPAGARASLAATIVGAVYEPEVARYGGPHGMLLSEDLFVASSNLATAVLGATRADFGRRITYALRFMLATAAAIPSDRRGRFFADYADFWKRFLRLEKTGNAAPPVPSIDPETFIGGLDGRRADDPYRYWQTQVASFGRRLGELATAGQLRSPAQPDRPVISSDVPRALDSIVGSQMHMLNNRLGISPSIEYSLAQSASRAILPGFV